MRNFIAHAELRTKAEQLCDENEELKAENAKLRDKTCKAEVENTKLLDLAARMLRTIKWNDQISDSMYWPSLSYERELREFGIEV